MASPDFIAENIRAGGADAICVLQHRARAAHRHKGGQWSRVAILPQIGNGADGISDIEGKVARVAMSKLGNERVSITSPTENPSITRQDSCNVVALQSPAKAFIPDME